MNFIRFEKLHKLAIDVCNDCVETFHLWDVDRAAKCRLHTEPSPVSKPQLNVTRVDVT